MQKYYKHQKDEFVWLLEVLGEKNEDEYHCLQYVKNGICPVEWSVYKLYFEFETRHWSPVSEQEAGELIGNLKEQKEARGYRFSEANIKWAKDLAKVLNSVPGLCANELLGVVQIASEQGQCEIYRELDGEMKCKKK